MWFGSFGGGLLRFNGKYFTLYSRSDGLSNDIITSLRQDRHGNLWIGTKMGPNMLRADKFKLKPGSPNSNIFKSFTYDDGFLGIGCNLNAQLEDKNGVIWFGSSNRLTAIKPDEEVPDTVAPNIKLTNIQLFNESIPWSDIDPRTDTSIILGNSVHIHHFQFSNISKWYFLPEELSLYHDNNFLTFHYIGISQSQTPKIRYEYWLEGLDRNWSSPTDHTEAAYGNLNPGRYNFKVKAMNAEGIWSKECSFAFSIRPPWWKTWWFYALAFLVAVLTILGYIRIREYQHIAQKKLLSKIIDEQTYELKDKNRELENMNNELIIANSEKDKFFSIIAHDVRGPLGTFHLFTELMAENLETYEPKEIRLMANSMHDSASSLFKLLENLLIWARMQRGLIQFSPEQLNTIEVLNNAVETNLQTARNKSIAIIVDISDSLEIFADKNMAESILRNLISNAVKFTPRGGKVTISAEKKDDSVILFSVADTGIGMDQNALIDLFKIDIHNKRKGTEGESSAGLGLLLCSDFVKKLNGRIWAESEVGKGSTFYFTIPSVS
jgi:signal transduction histidine kinase